LEGLGEAGRGSENLGETGRISEEEGGDCTEKAA